MRFSVILPSHNGADRIRTALKSIREQTFKDYELIVVCDACSDNTSDIAREYRADRVLSVDHHRCGLARNDGIAVARGEYLLFMDDDDTWLNREVFKSIDSKLKENPDVDVLCFGFLFNSYVYAGCRDNGGSYWTAVWNKCWRREFVTDCKFSDTTRGSDIVFTNQVLAKNPKLVEWEIPLYDYNHMRVGSITETYFRGKK